MVLTLENKISSHKKTIPDETMNFITINWKKFKETERLIFHKLFKDQEATIDELATACGVGEKAVRGYLNKMINNEIILRDSKKLRDKNAKFRFRKNTDK